jgi:glycosyltransferase involved in cell wall biosynthesis
MAREAVGLSRRFLATSEFAASLARLDAAPADRGKVAALPLAFGIHCGRPPADPARPGSAVVASFGLVNALKQTGTLLEAFATVVAVRANATLAVVGPCGEADRSALREQASRLGLVDRVTVTGRVDDEQYRGGLERAAVAVQLRAATNGETSAAVGDCLASAVPTVVSAVGPARDLPDEAVVKVPADVQPAELAGSILALLDVADRRRALGRAAAAYAAERSFPRTARALYEILTSVTGRGAARSA